MLIGEGNYGFFHFFFPLLIGDFFSHTIVVGKHTWYDFSFLKFAKTFFVAYNMIYSGVLRRMCNLMLLDEMSYKGLLNTFGLKCG